MTRPDLPFDLDGFLPYQLNQAAAATSEGFAAIYRDRFGLTIAEWRVLAHLSQAEKVSVREIHARVGMEKPRVSRAAARLEAAGHVVKVPSQRDKRLVELSLSPGGRAMMAELAEAAAAFQARLLAQLGADAPVVIAALERLRQTARE